jgi:hypothetical protein
VLKNALKHIICCSNKRLTKRGIVKVKGKGEVNTYWLNEHLQSPATAANEDREHSHPLHQQQQEPGASVTEQQVSGGSRLLVKRKNSQLISPAVAVETKEMWVILSFKAENY